MIRGLGDPERFGQVRRKLVFLAWYKFRIGQADAEDIAQTALATYCEVKERYAGEENQLGILLGIFRKKCLEFVHRNRKEREKLKQMAADPAVAREHTLLGPAGEGRSRGVIEDLIRREDGRLILSALAELKPESRRLFELLAEDGLGRKGLIEHYGLNKNTLDSRLRAARHELRELLRAKGVIF